MSDAPGVALVTGASGFIGRALVPALVERGFHVIAASRNPGVSADTASVEWRVCDLLDASTLESACRGARVAFYLVHSMGSDANYRALERRAAASFLAAATRAGIERIVYLGGPAPRGVPSEHLRSRLEVGEILRAGSVPVVELRASMVIGCGGASFQIVRDLADRLPIMVLPKWLSSRTSPVALSDVVAALLAAAEMPIAESTWFDIPGPEVMSCQQILERIARLRGKRFLAVKVPLLTPRLSALWLRLVTRTNFALARELVLGLQEDLLAEDDRFWQLAGHPQLRSFDDAVKQALAGG
jgi:uncharacterized protein YbjT (DUF2867 family)